MNKHKKTVSYVFGAGRLKKITSGEKIAREFFYGYYFFSENKNVPIIEMKLPNDSKNVLLNYIDKIGESMVVIDKKQIPISRSYREAFFAEIKRY